LVISFIWLFNWSILIGFFKWDMFLGDGNLVVFYWCFFFQFVLFWLVYGLFTSFNAFNWN
jgi:hypothetical protein